MQLPARPAVRRARGDDGVGLIEVLIAVGLLGVAFVAILSGLAVVAKTSRTHEVRADTNAVLVGAAEAVKALDFCDPAESCNPDTAYEAALNAVDLPTGWSRSNVHVRLPIVPVSGAGRLVQNITVDVVSPQGGATVSLTVAKAGPPPPPPPTIPVPTDVCTSATVTAHAFSILFFVIVEVTIPPDAAACVKPIRARVVGGAALTLNQNSSTRWSGFGFLNCFFSCDAQVDILQGNGTLIMTVDVESFF